MPRERLGTVLRRLTLASMVAVMVSGSPHVFGASASSAGPTSMTMPTYQGPDGVRVPLGACTVVNGRQVSIIACNSPQARAYAEQVAARKQTAQAARRGTNLELGIGAGALIVGSWAVLIAAAERRKRNKAATPATNNGGTL